MKLYPKTADALKNCLDPRAGKSDVGAISRPANAPPPSSKGEIHRPAGGQPKKGKK